MRSRATPVRYLVVVIAGIAVVFVFWWVVNAGSRPAEKAAIPSGIVIHGEIPSQETAKLLAVVRQVPDLMGESVVEVRDYESIAEIYTLAPEPRLHGSGHRLIVGRYYKNDIVFMGEWISFGAEKVSLIGEFTGGQLLAIYDLIKQHAGVNADPIIAIFWSGAEVVVKTGVQRGPLDGEGHNVTLRETDGQWHIVSVAYWVS